jgi:hypothetical protein
MYMVGNNLLHECFKNSFIIISVLQALLFFKHLIASNTSLSVITAFNSVFKPVTVFVSIISKKTSCTFSTFTVFNFRAKNLKWRVHNAESKNNLLRCSKAYTKVLNSQNNLYHKGFIKKLRGLRHNDSKSYWSLYSYFLHYELSI